MRVPSHRVGPPETLSDVQYGNLIRPPDRRTLIGKRDHALLRLMGDCGVRYAELRGLTMRDPSAALQQRASSSVRAWQGRRRADAYGVYREFVRKTGSAATAGLALSSR